MAQQAFPKAQYGTFSRRKWICYDGESRPDGLMLLQSNWGQDSYL